MSAPKLVVIGAARSGTTILNKVLMQSPDLHMYEHYEIFSNHYSSLDQKIFDFDISEFETDRFISDDQHNKICWKKYCQKAHEYYDGFKLLTWHLKNDVEEYLNECKVVLISRKNKLQVVASHKIATITDCWVGTDPFDGTIFLDPENTKSHVDRIVKAEKNLLKYDPCIVYYEDSMQGNIDKICDFLGVPRYEIKYNIEKRIRKSMRNLISNYDEVRQYDRELFVLH